MSRVIAAGDTAKPAVVAASSARRPAVVMAGLRGAPGADGEGSGVSSFNARTGAVALAGSDVTTALGYTPADNASLATVAYTGAYADLSGKPFIPAIPGDIGAASAAQGALADTAVQPAALTVLLGLKVDKIAGYGLSQENFTSAEKNKLAGMEGSRWKGTFPSLGALQDAYPTAEPGDYADVDVESAPILRYIWDDTDAEWVSQVGETAPITASQVKTLYESNEDTNPFDDAAKDKLSGIAASATKNSSTDELSEGLANLYHTAARVRAVVLTGLSTATTTVVAATDTILQAIGKLAGRLETAFDRDNHTGTQAISTVAGLEAALSDKLPTSGTAADSNKLGGELPAFYAPVPQVTTVSSSRTLALTDAGNYLVTSAAAAMTLTIPPQADATWPANAEIHIEQGAAGAVTIAAGTGVTLQHGASAVPTTREAHSPVTLKRKVEDVWVVFGALEAAE